MLEEDIKSLLDFVCKLNVVGSRQANIEFEHQPKCNVCPKLEVEFKTNASFWHQPNFPIQLKLYLINVRS